MNLQSKPESVRERLYKIVDSFLVEAKDQNGIERSLERLNKDRHLAVDQLEALIQEEVIKQSKGKFLVKALEICPKCNGEGSLPNGFFTSRICRFCEGIGKIR